MKAPASVADFLTSVFGLLRDENPNSECSIRHLQQIDVLSGPDQSAPGNDKRLSLLRRAALLRQARCVFLDGKTFSGFSEGESGLPRVAFFNYAVACEQGQRLPDLLIGLSDGEIEEVAVRFHKLFGVLDRLDRKYGTNSKRS